MDPMTAAARPIEQTSDEPPVHLHLAPIDDPAVPLVDVTQIFPNDSFRRGCGTEAITTTTMIASDPAPVVPAEQSTSAESSYEVDRTLAAMHVPILPQGEGTNVSTPSAKTAMPANDPVPPPEHTCIVEHVPRPPVSEGTRVAAHVPAAAPQPIERVSSSPVPTHIEDSVSSPILKTQAIILREPKVAAPPRESTGARLVVPGHYLVGDEQPVAIETKIGNSILLGREKGSVLENDPYVDAHHAEVTFRPDGIAVQDLDSTNGVFVRVRAPMVLRSRDEFRVGEQLLGYTAIKRGPKNGKAPALGSPNPGYWGRIDVLLAPEQVAASYPVDDREVAIGQTDGHVQFPDDPFVDGLHCRILRDDRGVVLEDCGSEHGTWLRLRSGDVVPYGAELMVGHTLLRLERM